jgi:hypothetical protein
MAKLDAAARKKMPKKEFAGPKKSFPVNDKNHARLAISGATRSENAGNISPAEAASIKAKARKKLGKGKLSEAIEGAMGDEE